MSGVTDAREAIQAVISLGTVGFPYRITLVSHTLPPLNRPRFDPDPFIAGPCFGNFWGGLSTV